MTSHCAYLYCMENSSHRYQIQSPDTTGTKTLNVLFYFTESMNSFTSRPVSLNRNAPWGVSARIEIPGDTYVLPFHGIRVEYIEIRRVLHAPTPRVTRHVFLAGGKKSQRKSVNTGYIARPGFLPALPLARREKCHVPPCVLESDTNPNFARITRGDTRLLQFQDRLMNFTSRRRTIIKFQ